MKKSELKALIRETIRESITDIILEDRLFSNIISEIMINTKKMVLESSNVQTVQPANKQPVSRYKEIASNFSSRNRDQFQRQTVEQTAERPVFDLMSENVSATDMQTYKKAEEMADAINTVPVKTLDFLFSGKKLM